MNETPSPERQGIRSAVATAAGTSSAHFSMGAKIDESASLRRRRHPLDRADARVHRAEQHLRELIERVSQRGQQQVDAMKVFPNPHNPKQVVVDPRSDLPLDLMFGVLVGEICYNLRAALDYLVYELAKLDSGTPQANTQFPIVNVESNFPAARRNRLRGLNDAHVTMIENLQPYQRGSWTGKLRDVSNPDKHQTLTAVQADHELTVHVADKEHVKDFEDLPGPIRPMKTGDGTEVFVKFHLTTKLQFADGSSVIEPLEQIKEEVAQTIETFRPEFG